MKIERKAHPRGENGTHVSLEEAARRAAEGRLDPRTRAWAIEKIVQAGDPPTIVERATVLLNALRKERIYIEDPTDADFMPSAACTLAGCEGLKFLGEDCDGLLIAFNAACGSIGIFTAIVGHAYSETRQLTHVLAGVWDGTRWWHCDPSTKQPFGQVSPATRERWVCVHDGRMLCDGPSCDLTKIESPMKKMRSSGDFVGVGRPQEREGSGMVGEHEGGEIKLELGNAQQQAEMVRKVTEDSAMLNVSLNEVIFEHERLVALRDYLNKPIVDMDVTQPVSYEFQNDVSPDEVWSQQDEIEYQRAIGPALLAVKYGQDVATGHRVVAFNPANGEIFIMGKPEESAVDFVDGKPVTLGGHVANGTTGWVIPTAVLWIGGALLFAVVAVGGFGAYSSYCSSKTAEIQHESMKELKSFYEKRIAQGATPEQAGREVEQLTSASNKLAAARVQEIRATDPGMRIMDTIETMAWAAFGVALIGGAIYGAIQLLPLLKRRREARLLAY